MKPGHSTDVPFAQLNVPVFMLISARTSAHSMLTKYVCLLPEAVEPQAHHLLNQAGVEASDVHWVAWL